MEAVMLHHNRKLDRHMSAHPSEFFQYPTFPFGSSFNGGAAPYAPPFSVQGPPMDPRGHHYHVQQPPLLPLPIPNPYHNNNKRVNNKLIRHQSLSVKKSNFSGAGQKREKTRPNESGLVTSGHRLGPEPKDVPKVLFSGKSNSTVNIKEIHNFVASTVVSPPPSSLPLPTFSIRPKLASNSPAVDAGATNGLRRILQLP